MFSAHRTRNLPNERSAFFGESAPRVSPIVKSDALLDQPKPWRAVSVDVAQISWLATQIARLPGHPCGGRNVTAAATLKQLVVQRECTSVCWASDSLKFNLMVSADC
jgi:hypothetical protein